MPSTSAQLREFIIENYGSLDSGVIEKELERRGFTLTKDWCWKRGRIPDMSDWKLINFLVEEWDYGGYDAD